MSNIVRKIDMYLKEAEIDWSGVKEAAVDAAKDIHGDADEKTIDSMIEKVKKNGKAKDTEDAVQIVINMLRS